MNQFELIKGSKQIAKFLGYNAAHTRTSILPEMRDYGCAFKENRRKTANWITSPYFINLYLFLKHTQRDSNKPPIDPRKNGDTKADKNKEPH